MSLVIKPKVIFVNAFLARDVKSLGMDELRAFCNILYDKLVEGGYKYVVLEAGRRDIEVFCEKDGQFAQGIDKIHCLKPVTKEYMEKVNSVFPPDVEEILHDVRMLFAVT